LLFQLCSVTPSLLSSSRVLSSSSVRSFVSHPNAIPRVPDPSEQDEIPVKPRTYEADRPYVWIFITLLPVAVWQLTTLFIDIHPPETPQQKLARVEKAAQEYEYSQKYHATVPKDRKSSPPPFVFQEISSIKQ
jgi:hypothetical protein